MHDIAALTDVRSFLLAMNDVFSLDSCIKVENVMNENYEIRMKSEMQKKYVTHRNLFAQYATRYDLREDFQFD